ncbi:MAG: hypothetical protein ABIG03_04340 [Candidatus Eisenbacteria bacterium]
MSSNRFLTILVLLVVVLTAPLLWAQEEGEEEEEEEETAEPGQFYGTLRNDAEVSTWDPQFHPVYKLSHTRDQDISAWNHNFNMNYDFSPKISFRASSTIGTRENDVLSRLNRQETWNAALDLAMSSALSTGLKFTRTNQEDIRNQGESNETRSFRERESVNLTTDYRKVYLNGVGVTLGASGGFEQNDYADVSSRGSNQKINAGLRYEAPLGIGTDFHYTGTRSLLDSEQGVTKTTNESTEHTLTGHVEYDWAGNSFSVDLRRGASNKEYPKQEQTEIRTGNTEAIDFSANLAVVEGLTTTTGLSYSRSRTSYDIEPDKSTELKTRAANASIAYVLGQTRFTAELRTEKKRNDYFDTQTGDTYTNSVGASLTHGFGEKLTAVMRGRTSLLSHHYDDAEANDQDRDLFDQEGTLQLDYLPKNGIATSVLIKVRQDELIYIRTSRTGDNKESQTYSIHPSITKSLGSTVSVTQKYELSADYTFYTYDQDSNFLIRSFAVNTGVDWRPLKAVRLSIDHKYRAQDEGAYVEDDDGVERYGKNSERDNKSLTLRFGYKLFTFIDFEIRQTFSIQRKWQMEDGERELSWEKFDTVLTGQATADYELPSGTTLKFNVGRTYRDATSILDRQREVWDISLNIEKTF